MASPPIPPNADAAFLAWSRNFRDYIAIHYAALGITLPESTLYATKHDAYSDAYDVATNEVTRTRGTIAAKDDARDACKFEARLLIQRINGIPTVTTQQRRDLALNVRAQPTRIPRPAVAPEVDVAELDGRSVTIKLHSSTSGTRRGRPPGVAAAAIYTHVGPTAPASVADWFYQGSVTKTRTIVHFDTSVPAGSQVWIIAQWLNPRSESGPASVAVSTYLAGGTSAMAA